MSSEIAEIYGNKVRIRVCGLCWQNDSLLVVKHKMDGHDFWSPPGGGVEFGESLTAALQREFAEETGLEVVPGNFLFGCEFIKAPLHAIELFFDVKMTAGHLKTGYDPELQVIEQAVFLSPAEIQQIPVEARHGILKRYDNANMLRQLTGFYRI
ncbi:NUDIX hydrolase [Chryseolinea sp. H1M3-3]|uniref:NUDIX domain-containing protein n=1 Tax=Chryseolinea sp. H1M3-3 TaxID=3034144 RepID=UPI0023ED57D6|nr:NUDIX hydrolase [Chryseolinea sp. H1M3-3]